MALFGPGVADIARANPPAESSHAMLSIVSIPLQGRAEAARTAALRLQSRAVLRHLGRAEPHQLLVVGHQRLGEVDPG